jgi:hypothetical protein
MMADNSGVLSFKKTGEVNFKEFGMAVAQDDIKRATRILRDLLNLEFIQAEKATLHFKEKFDTEPNLLMKTMQIRTHIELGQQNDALVIIQDIFNLSGFESINALESIKKVIKDAQGPTVH